MVMDSVKMEAEMLEFPCTECSKKFRSWKALFGHMRCHPDRLHRGMLNYFRIPADDPCSSSSDDYEVADCLLMLANGTFDRRNYHNRPSSSSSNKLKLIKLPQMKAESIIIDKNDKGKAVMTSTATTTSSGGGLVIRHKCSKCLRVFSSGQALGGHKRSCLHHHDYNKVEGSSSHPPPPSSSRVVVNLGFDLNSCPLLLVQGNNDDHDDSKYSDLDLELRL